MYIAFSGYHTLIFLRQYHYLHARRPFCIEIGVVHRIEEHGIISSTPQSSPPYILPTSSLLLSLLLSRLVSFFHLFFCILSCFSISRLQELSLPVFRALLSL